MEATTHMNFIDDMNGEEWQPLLHGEKAGAETQPKPVPIRPAIEKLTPRDPAIAITYSKDSNHIAGPRFSVHLDPGAGRIVRDAAYELGKDFILLEFLDTPDRLKIRAKLVDPDTEGARMLPGGFIAGKGECRFFGSHVHQVIESSGVKEPKKGSVIRARMIPDMPGIWTATFWKHEAQA